ncbi:hypothetical protein VFMJ11_1042 [Aliivibrio fischeri MJ11]|uniref:Uncharacterized protein n=1 Tax=Aliivibrio fischeri (strain MJ11) TaxID=388396 RepID=B5FD45_ALIFM|nr:hypothetical protein VFMJ11_1042 [Aliivibrio fischeri MJ11]
MSNLDTKTNVTLLTYISFIASRFVIYKSFLAEFFLYPNLISHQLKSDW